MIARFSEASRADRFAAGCLGLSLLGLTLAAVLPVAPARDATAPRAGIGMPTPPGAGVAGAFGRASPFDPQHRPVMQDALLQSAPEPVVDLAPLPAAAEETPVRLSGVLVGEGARKALFAQGAGWQAVGTDVAGWTIAAIGREGVTLSRDGRTMVLKSRDALLAR